MDAISSWMIVDGIRYSWKEILFTVAALLALFGGRGIWQRPNIYGRRSYESYRRGGRAQTGGSTPKLG